MSRMGGRRSGMSQREIRQNEIRQNDTMQKAGILEETAQKGTDGKGQDCLKWGLTAFVSLSAVIVFFFFLFRLPVIGGWLGVMLSALKPVLIGMVLAYLLCPIAAFLERHLRRIGRFARLVSVLVTLALAFAVVALFCALVLPQLAGSVSELVGELPGQLQAQLERLSNYLKSDSEAGAAVMQMVESVEKYLMNWTRENLLSTVSSISGRVLSLGSMLINLVVAVIVSIYLLLDRERYLAQCRKLFLAVSHNDRFNAAVLDAVRQTDRIFSGFISGKLVDSLIVGVICFVCLTLLRMPYALLVSVLVGVTNVIPMFGPFIGAVPSAFLILLVSPAKCVIFLIFIILLQQVDGNIIGPRILGNSTGLSALYVTVAMLLFGKLLGFLGMIVGVPLFATLYYIIKRLAEHSLRKRNLPAETEAYLRPEKENVS